MKHLKQILFILLFFIYQSNVALAAQKPAKVSYSNNPPSGFTYGFGLAVKREIYKGYEQRVIPLPLIGYKGEKLTVFGPFISYQLYQLNHWSLSSTLSPRFEGFDQSDSAIFEGMAERKFSMDAGFALHYKPRTWRLSTDVKADILGRSNGYETNFQLGKIYPVGHFLIEPSLGLTYLSESIVDYYYGVRANEETNTRDFYRADAALNSNVAIGLSARMFSGLFRAQFKNTWYDSAIKNSPLTDSKTSFSVMISYARFFN